MKTLKLSQSATETLQLVCCPNCGKEAERRFYPQQDITETTCPTCDYLLINSSKGDVLEAYAPGIGMSS